MFPFRFLTFRACTHPIYLFLCVYLKVKKKKSSPKILSTSYFSTYVSGYLASPHTFEKNHAHVRFRDV